MPIFILALSLARGRLGCKWVKGNRLFAADTLTWHSRVDGLLRFDFCEFRVYKVLYRERFWVAQFPLTLA